VQAFYLAPQPPVVVSFFDDHVHVPASRIKQLFARCFQPFDLGLELSRSTPEKNLQVVTLSPQSLNLNAKRMLAIRTKIITHYEPPVAAPNGRQS
jgi:hypothetical protein